MLKEIKQKELIDTLLKKGAVAFKFFRVTYSSPRVAIGTLDFNQFIIPTPQHHIKHPPGLVVYWDLERLDWRSFYIDEVKYYFKVLKEDIDDLKRGRLIDPAQKFNYERYFNM